MSSLNRVSTLSVSPISDIERRYLIGYYLPMDFKTYWLSMSVADRKAFAVRCGCSPNYLNLYAHGLKPRLGEAIAIAIDRESQGKVRCEDLRPDVDWAYLRGTGCRSIANEQHEAA